MRHFYLAGTTTFELGTDSMRCRYRPNSTARKASTARAYRREAERLLLWAIIVRRKPLSSLNTLTFLTSTCFSAIHSRRGAGSARAKRNGSIRHGGPSPNHSPKAAVKSPASCCRPRAGWLVREQCPLVTPIHGLANVGSTKRADGTTGRTLMHAQRRFMLQTVSRPDPTRAEQRDHFALLLAYATGLPCAQLVAATTRCPVAQGARWRVRRRVDPAGRG